MGGMNPQFFSLAPPSSLPFLTAPATLGDSSVQRIWEPRELMQSLFEPLVASRLPERFSTRAFRAGDSVTSQRLRLLVG